MTRRLQHFIRCILVILLGLTNLAVADADTDGRKAISEKIHAINELAGIEAENENYTNSLQLSQTALDLSSKYGILDESALANQNLAKNYLALNNKYKAIGYLEESIRLYEKLGKDQQAMELHRQAAELFSQSGNYQASLQHTKRFQEIKDSLSESQQEKQIAGLKEQFSQEISATEDRLAAVQSDKQKTTGVFLVIALVLLFLVAAALVIAIKKHMQVKRYFLRLNEQKDRMFSLISHGLRGPIGSVKGIFDLIVEQELDDPKELKSILNESREVVDSSFNLLENLLNWSKSQTGNLTVNPQKISIGSLVKENLMLFTSSIKHKNFTIENHVDDNHYAFADQEMVNIVIRNIISNSVKFTRTAGKISIYSQIAKDKLLLTVADTGVGMTRELIEEIMEDDAVTFSNDANYEKDRGIGLKICKDFLQKNQGKLSIESSPNEGSRFFIYLPISA